MELYLTVHAQLSCVTYFSLEIAWHFDLTHPDELSYWGIIVWVIQTNLTQPKSFIPAKVNLPPGFSILVLASPSTQTGKPGTMLDFYSAPVSTSNGSLRPLGFTS